VIGRRPAEGITPSETPSIMIAVLSLTPTENALNIFGFGGLYSHGPFNGFIWVFLMSVHGARESTMIGAKANRESKNCVP
jgi:hypothetical protein